MIHRDIKPGNILVSRAEGRTRYVLTDFGIGRASEGIQVEKHTGGTYFFMAPEQMRGRPVPQSDLWALGVVAYQLLTGRLPFPGPTLRELTQQICYANPTPPGVGQSEPLDPDLESAVVRLLDKSLQERVASADELLRLLGHRGPAAQAVVVCVLLCVLLSRSVLGSILMLGGLALFYKAQSDERFMFCRADGGRTNVFFRIYSDKRRKVFVE